MSEDRDTPQGPDLRAGVPSTRLPEGGVVAGHVGDDSVLLIRHRGDAHAVAATCTHWGGPLAEGLVVEGTLRCPWHHACFDARTGALLGGPAMEGLARWRVSEREGTVRVGDPLPAVSGGPTTRPVGGTPEAIVVVGAGSAGTVAAVGPDVTDVKPGDRVGLVNGRTATASRLGAALAPRRAAAAFLVVRRGAQRRGVLLTP